ncbi:uncharacterized protein EV420DRAFT_127453 [Desarmillaria tabescens]|uniref:Uncharacterized protein n=1 Tax=Armillaria tabescens TaxID=1929756 RepID=A0AA39T3G7_ARMTA|nr:uncharacterized protein EV420DRAFT_127453 [Desarmillaria tabescens]KAK0461771.1 hypothetical protein EV420DRAFT_127453 [Desarmillaria tabescens]
MLANEGSSVSRPRPPAQMRRSHSMFNQKGSPPPPYASSFVFPSQKKLSRSSSNTLLGSPVSATFRRIEREAGKAVAEEDNMDWLNEKSREELSGLLLKADDIIKKRETELERTSSLCKSLYDDNVSLKSKHQDLFARFPGSLSPAASSSPSPTPLQSPHLYTNSISRSASAQSSKSNFYSTPQTDQPRRRVRKVSVRLDDISLLADQNDELLQKIERLETEAASADLAGRRMLRRLEKEISQLREDLEKTQARSQEFEEKAERMAPIEAAWRRKLEQEAKAEASHSKSEISEEEEEIRDFAPGGILSRPSTSSIPDVIPSEGTTPQITALCDAFTGLAFSSVSPPSEDSTTQAQEPQARIEPELAIVSQLLAKIQELEEANLRIIRQQSETANKLIAVQQETENMSKVYESLNDSKLEFMEGSDTTSEKPRLSDDSTIRFKSFRKSLEGDIRRPTTDDSFINMAGTHKSRKSVMGLFESPERLPTETSSPYKSKGLTTPFKTPLRHHQHSWSTESDVHSPTLSSVHFSSSACSTPPQGSGELSPSPFFEDTLQNELGSQFGDDWGLNTGFHHLRSSSIYDLSQISAPPSPSPVPHNFSSLYSADLDASSREHIHQTPVASMRGGSILQLTLEPPTPDKNEDEGPALRRKRSRLMSQTIRSRTTRWVNGRFTDKVLSPPSSAAQLHPEVPHIEEPEQVAEQETDVETTPRADRRKSLLVAFVPMPRRLSRALDTVVTKFAGHARATEEEFEGSMLQRETSPPEQDRMELHVDKATVTEKSKGFTGILIEVWMWLQFAIIILVFLFAMAKKGPKTIIGDAERRVVRS